MPSGFPDYQAFEIPVLVVSGGTGATSLASNGVIIGKGTAPLVATAAGAANEVLRVPPAGGAPAFGALDLGQAVAVTGTLPVARGGTGTATGSITGTGALVFAAGGANQNVTLTPSGTGYTICNGMVGINTTTPKVFSGVSMGGETFVHLVAVPTFIGALALSGTRAHIYLRSDDSAVNTKNVRLRSGLNEFSITPLNDDVTEKTPALTVNLSTSAVTFGAAISAASASLTSPLPVTSGGTGVASCAVGQILIASGTNTAAFTTPDGARVYNFGNLTIAHNTWTALTFDSERYDNGGLHSTVSNTSRLTAQKAGKYLITGHVYWGANTVNERLTRFMVNAGTPIAMDDTLASTVTYTLINLATLYHLAAGDYVELQVHQNSGGALDVLVSAAFSPEFAMQWLGP